MKKKCLIAVEGGTGKNIMLTALLPIIKEKYEEVYITTPYYDVFKACPYVDDAFPMGQPNLYQELCLNDDVDILWREPYSNCDFIKKRCHLFDAWLEELNLKLPEGKTAMELTPNLDPSIEYPQVVEDAKQMANELGKFIIVQFCGGQSPLGDTEKPQYDEKQEGIKRNYHKAQQLINLLREEYPDAKILHFALQNEPDYEGTQKIIKPYLVYTELAKYAFKVVCTDSSLQHLVSGKCKDTTVIWLETRPNHFGYACNKNICANNVNNSQPYFKPLGASPAIVKAPTPEQVMEVVKMTKEEYDNNDTIVKL